MLKFVILAILSVPSILATLTSEEMASALITAKDSGTLEDTFKTFEKEQSHDNLSLALFDVARQGHILKVVDCLRMAHDPFPKDNMRMSVLVNNTLARISKNTNTEAFTNAITSFKPSDAKLLVSIRICTFWRYDGVNVLKSVMKKSPELITDNLPSWIAFHTSDRNSRHYDPVQEESFKYLTYFATQSVLEKALIIVRSNEHYTITYKDGHTEVRCCNSQDSSPQDLFDKINVLLELVKARNARINDILTLLPMVLVDLVLDYVHVTVSDCSDSSSRCLIS